MAMIYGTTKTIQEEIRDNLKALAFGQKLVGVQYIGTDESMGGIQYYGIITQWKNHPAYGDIFMPGIINRHVGEDGSVYWCKVARAVFQENTERPVLTPASLLNAPTERLAHARQVWEERALKEARIWLYEQIARELKTSSWDADSRRD